MRPPYYISAEIMVLITEISEKLGAIRTIHKSGLSPQLRRKNQVKTIHSSLAIEGNLLSEAQVTAILDEQRVIGPAQDIQEVKNAIAAYARLGQYKPYVIQSFLTAHLTLMDGLIDSAGSFRTGNAGIAKGSQLTHLAPPGNMVKPLMAKLFDYLKNDKEILLIKSCVFHYELEFIHPFSDGNGRMGRLWQTLLLSHHHPIFAYTPVESMVKKSQQAYYDALGKSDKQGESTAFITFMLGMISKSLDVLLNARPHSIDAGGRLLAFRQANGNKPFTRKDYLKFHHSLSPATASRDLQMGTSRGMLLKEGDKRLTEYRFG